MNVAIKVLKYGLLILSAVAGFIVINAWLSFAVYNLYSGGKWESGKTKLEKGVWGGWAMMLSNAALTGGALNINAWHGYQELTLKQPVPAKKIEFSFSSPSVAFSFIIHKTDSITTGVMIYPNGEEKICFYTANHGGKFLTKNTVPLAEHLLYRKVPVEILFFKDSVEIDLNHALAATFLFHSPQKIKPGFKGSSEYKDVFVDDIKIISPKGAVVFYERFDFPLQVNKWSWCYLFFWFLVLMYCVFKNQLSGFVVYCSCVVAFCMTLFFGYYYYLGAAKYSFNPNSINWQGIQSSIEEQEDVEKRVGIEYPLKDLADKKRVILFIGASQTWGGGASSSKNTFVALVEDSLKHFLNDTNLTVINCGVSAINSAQMYERYIHRWVKYKPLLTVINMSNTDADTSIFRKNLQAFACYNQQREIGTLFIEGPFNGCIKPTEQHLIMRDVALKNNIVSVETQSCLENYADSGFLWWDAVHLADYGHIIYANRLFPFIATELTLDSTNQKAVEKPRAKKQNQ